ncbi:MAG: hypothetical protein H6722_33895 [Sandaracinus sp.]|nr:hypothetical protein [Sandaracinus sp.]
MNRTLRFVIGGSLLVGTPGCGDDPVINPAFDGGMDAGFDASVDGGFDAGEEIVNVGDTGIDAPEDAAVEDGAVEDGAVEDGAVEDAALEDAGPPEA